MTTKTRIVDILGESALALPAAIESAVGANERAKYVLALLQMATIHADRPDAVPESLRAEREACGIAEPTLDRVVAGAEADGKGCYFIKEMPHLFEILSAALHSMLAPLALVARTLPADAISYEKQARRLEALLKSVPPLDDGLISSATIADLTSGRPRSGDGIHLLVMDLHKELNRLIASISEETIAGARAYGIEEGDRTRIAAFMAGLQRTAPLKFDHHGLDTTAVRADGALLIQNDIGETEAHVIVVRIANLAVSLTYTDVHAQRLRFLQSMLDGSGIVWDEVSSRHAAGLGDSDLFYMTVGHFAALDEAALGRFLDRLGSRIVFLIDWNRARKRLGLFVPNALAVEVLTWAAEREVGHRAFLQLGGERLVYDALESGVRTPLRYGEPLHDMIGAGAAREFLRFMLEATATGLRDGRSELLIRDRIRVELFNHFRTVEQRLLADAAEHGALILQLARGLDTALRHVTASHADQLGRNAKRAKELESHADEIVKTMRATVRRTAGTAIFCRALEVADDAADALEDAAFLGGLLADAAPSSGLPPPLLELAGLVVAASDAFCRFLKFAPDMHRGAAREQIENFLATADELVTIEHQTDAKEREVTTTLFQTASEWRQLHLLSGIAHHLEMAGDALLHASLMLRDHVLGETLSI